MKILAVEHDPNLKIFFFYRKYISKLGSTIQNFIYPSKFRIYNFKINVKHTYRVINYLKLKNYSVIILTTHAE